MSFMPITALTKNNTLNKYQMVMIAAREARRLNKIPKEERGEEGARRVTTLALRRLAEGLVGFVADEEQGEGR